MKKTRKKIKFSKKENKKNKKATEDIIDQTLKDTFPASDPPAWYGGKDKKSQGDHHE